MPFRHEVASGQPRGPRSVRCARRQSSCNGAGTVFPAAGCRFDGLVLGDLALKPATSPSWAPWTASSQALRGRHRHHAVRPFLFRLAYGIALGLSLSCAFKHYCVTWSSFCWFGSWWVPGASGRAPEVPKTQTYGSGSFPGASGAPGARAKKPKNIYFCQSPLERPSCLTCALQSILVDDVVMGV